MPREGGGQRARRAGEDFVRQIGQSFSKNHRVRHAWRSSTADGTSRPKILAAKGERRSRESCSTERKGRQGLRARASGGGGKGPSKVAGGQEVGKERESYG